MAATGMDAMLELLAACGVRYLFGNPGTTELPLMDALLRQDRIQYILALQEVPAMAIADGYAQASGLPGVVNLHICCGLGNGMGMLYNAYRSGTPLVVTAGQQDQRMMFEEPILWGDMVAAVRPWTKWAAEVRRVEDLPSAVRRAIQAALAPPPGPVFLSLPLDVQMAEADLDLTPPALPEFWIRPAAEPVRRAAALLAQAENPAILAGNRVCQADAVTELVGVAERLGAPVIHEASTSHGRCSFPSQHPLAAGPLPFWSPEVRQHLAEFDVVLVAGMKLLEQYIYHPPRPIPEHLRLVQLDDDPWQLGKNYPVAVAVWGHPKAALADLATALDAVMTPAQVHAARDRGARRAQTHRQQREQLRWEAESLSRVRPVHPLYLMERLARILPDRVAVIDESPTTTASYFERVGALRDPSGYFAQRGWALGWGLGCAIGVKLAWPDRPVLAILGDGAAMYGIQGLWTAAHYRIPVTFLVTNNMQYKILKQCAGVLNLPEARKGRFLGLDVVEPAIDYVGLARSLGMTARQISEPDELAEAVTAALLADSPQLIEIPIHPG
ncbi:MAG: thiamine pyrophosphate-binding protein [Thermoguttaceae bacterium]